MTRRCPLGILQCCDRRPKGAQSIFDLLFILVAAPRPEEPFQAVVLAPRHDVHVEMGNTLAYTIIDGHEGAFRLHALHDGPREQPDIGEECANEGIGQIEECFDVALDDQQRMARKERTMVEEGEGDIVLEHFKAGHDPANDATKRTVFPELFLQNGGISHRISLFGDLLTVSQLRITEAGGCRVKSEGIGQMRGKV